MYAIRSYYATYSSQIPVYLPGEILLDMAEAYARSNQLTNAVEYLNDVLTKTDDVYGLNAAMDDQTTYLSSLSVITSYSIHYTKLYESSLKGGRL